MELSAFAHRSHLLHNVGWSPFPCIAHILFASRDVTLFIALLTSTMWDRALCIRALLSSPHDEVWSPAPPQITRIPSRIVRFSSPSSHLGWEVFHRINCSVFLLHLSLGLEGFLSNELGQVTDLTSSVFGFPPQLSH